MASTDASNKDEPSEFAALLAEFEGPKGSSKKQRAKKLSVGDEVRGRVLSISRDSVFVDLGGKNDGLLPVDDVRSPDGTVTVKVGDEVTARIVEIDGRAGGVLLRRMLGRSGTQGTEALRQAFEIGLPIEGTVSGVVKGGVDVQIGGARAFCPISQLDQRHVEDAAVFIGQKLSFQITRYEEGRSLNLVVSRRAVLEAEAQEKAVELRKKLAVGAVLPGRVTALKDYGAFVDLGGLEGMLHISELSFQRGRQPKDVLSIGQLVEVQVIKLEPSSDGKRGDKISLSLKSLEKDPWSDLETRYSLGSSVTGTVMRMEPFGAFIEIEPGVEGLVHISELGGGKKLRHPKDALTVGQRVELVIKLLDIEKRRLSLELAASQSAREDERQAVSSIAAQGPVKLGTLADLFAKLKKPAR